MLNGVFITILLVEYVYGVALQTVRSDSLNCKVMYLQSNEAESFETD